MRRTVHIVCLFCLGLVVAPGVARANHGSSTPYAGVLPVPGHPVDPAVPPTGFIAAFCQKPANEICGGTSDQADRAAWRCGFGDSSFAKRRRDTPEMARLRARLMPDGTEPPDRQKTDAWWDAYADYVADEYRQVDSLPGHLTAADITPILDGLVRTASEPGYHKLFGEAGLTGETPPLDDLRKATPIVSAADLMAVRRDSPKLLRGILKAFHQSCDREGDEDNAFNVEQRFIVLCPEKLARTAYLRSQTPGRKGATWGQLRTIAHELGHMLQYSERPEAYRGMVECLVNHRNQPGSDHAPLVDFELTRYMDEISADYWSGIALAQAVRRDPADAPSILRAELGFLCDSMGEKIEFGDPNPGGGTITDTAADTGNSDASLHPKGTWRIDFIGQQPQLRQALGCPAPAPRATVDCGLEGASPPGKW
jgi:hypothetical protein